VRIYIERERDRNLAIVGSSCTSDSGACARLAVTDPVSGAAHVEDDGQPLRPSPAEDGQPPRPSPPPPETEILSR
jgi:hypothetical protein